jgi:4-amino-4-deoxy-L-arabinose transferase-like glycosyltransferase
LTPLPPGRAAIRRDLTALALTAAVFFFVSLGARDLWNPNEPIYGQAVAEMHARGDWIVPTVNGHLFAEKPILYYWLALVASAPAGVSEFTLRVPSAAAGVAGVLLVYLLVVPYAGRTRARCAAVLFGTLFVVYWTSRAVQMDLLVGVATIGAVLPVMRIVDHGARPLRGWLLAGAFAGVGFLAKGPVGILCPALVVGVYLAVTGRLRLAFTREAAAVSRSRSRRPGSSRSPRAGRPTCSTRCCSART